jgi:hypothetical protein
MVKAKLEYAIVEGGRQSGPSLILTGKIPRSIVKKLESCRTPYTLRPMEYEEELKERDQTIDPKTTVRFLVKNEQEGKDLYEKIRVVLEKNNFEVEYHPK